MTDEAIASAKADIESTTDLLERALKLSGLITSLFAERGSCRRLSTGAKAERLASSPDFAVLDDFRRLRQEVSDGLAK